MTDEEVDRLIKDTRKYTTVIMDLRGNPGGYVKTLERVVGGVMDHDVTIAKRAGRKSDLKPEIAKSRGESAFPGKLIVLVDSRSASAAELFARVVQIEHRGTVLGDHSSGSVESGTALPGGMAQGLIAGGLFPRLPASPHAIRHGCEQRFND